MTLLKKTPPTHYPTLVCGRSSRWLLLSPAPTHCPTPDGREVLERAEQRCEARGNDVDVRVTGVCTRSHQPVMKRGQVVGSVTRGRGLVTWRVAMMLMCAPQVSAPGPISLSQKG